MRSFLFCMMICVCVSWCFGDDVLAPSWRGQPGSTVQEWDWGTYNPLYEPDLNNQTGMLAPDGLYTNTYGTSMSQITLHPGDAANNIPVGEWAYFPFGPAAGAGWWYGLTDAVFQVAGGDHGYANTQMRIQISYGTPGPHHLPETFYVETDGVQYTGQLIDTFAGGGVKYTSVFDFILPGAPTLENVVMSWDLAGFLNQVVIDTAGTDVPEPASLLLLTGGGAIVLSRRRK